MMKYIECKLLNNSDLNAINNGGGKIKNLLFNESFSFTFWFRIGSWLEYSNHGFLRFIFTLFYRRKMRRTGRQIPLGTRIGGGFRLIHYGTVVIHRKAIIGKNCTILHNVTIGKTHKGVPSIGDNVMIGANAVLVGPIHVGNNVVIGAGSVVVKDVPDNACVAGNPGRIVSQNGLIAGKGY
ncbi:serine O-acetyltransferase [Parabacteroides sp. MSK.9.14]|jgi:hypothetical protein|nr:DapH/DapD/GlmU-related protein [Parabacteroides sp. MSK.9.14]MBU9003921.1 serine acetyltransferase [Parabacteroides sp. MSK.9.14]